MKVLIVYGGYLPGKKYGGPVSSLYNLTELLGDEIGFQIICSNHDLNETESYGNILPGWNKVGKASVSYLSDREFRRQKFGEIIKEMLPDIVYISSIFDLRISFSLYGTCRKNNIPILLAPRGELNKTALHNGRFKKRLYLEYFKLINMKSNVFFHATSGEEFVQIKEALFPREENVFTVPNVPSMPEPKKKFEKKRGRLKICFVGRIVPNKNLLFALKTLRMCRSKITFDIFGSIENEAYWQECRKEIETMPENVLITYRSVINQIKMRECYHGYDFLLLPTQFENYGQSIVEAMLHDTPVIISRGTTPWDDIAEKGSGFLFDLDNNAELLSVIECLADYDNNAYFELVDKNRMYIKEKFDFDLLKNAYLDTFEKIKAMT